MFGFFCSYIKSTLFSLKVYFFYFLPELAFELPLQSAQSSAAWVGLFNGGGKINIDINILGCGESESPQNVNSAWNVYSCKYF